MYASTDKIFLPRTGKVTMNANRLRSSRVEVYKHEKKIHAALVKQILKVKDKGSLVREKNKRNLQVFLWSKVYFGEENLKDFESKICPSSPTIHIEISGNLKPSRSELEIRTETHANVFIGKITFLFTVLFFKDKSFLENLHEKIYIVKRQRIKS